MTPATQKQRDYIVQICNSLTGKTERYVSQHQKYLGLSSFQVERLSKAEASSIIEKLKKKQEKRAKK